MDYLEQSMETQETYITALNAMLEKAIKKNE